MKSLAFVLLTVAAGCTGGDDVDRPIVTNPGSPPTGGSAGGVSQLVTGRVCVAADLRTPTVCSADGAGGFAVTLGSTTTLTAADGTFTLPASTSTSTVTVSGTSLDGLTVVPTTSLVTSSSVILPAVDAELYNSILLANGIALGDGTGTILATVSRDGLATSGVTVVSTPTGIAGPLYAGSSGMVWTTSGTGTSGTILIPGVAAGTVDLSYETVLGGVETTVNGVSVRNGGVTVLDTTLPSTGTP